MKAKNLEEVYKIFDGQKFLTESEEEFFVPVYDDILKRFQLDLVLNEIPSKTFFIAGQTGNGKSTALNFMHIRNQKLKDKFLVKNLEAKDLFQYSDVGIIDILITIGIVLIEDDSELEREFLTELQKLRDTNLGLLEKTEDEIAKHRGSFEGSLMASVGISLFKLFETKSDLKTRFLSEHETRENVKKIFKADKSKVVEILNEIIRKFNQKNQPKKLLLTIDGLERKDNIGHIFSEELYVFDKIECEKIITIPVYLATEQTFVDKKIVNFNLKINENPFASNEGSGHIDSSENLAEIVKKRLENREIISDNAIRKAVEYSGGNIRQLIRLIHESALIALTNSEEKVTDHEVESAKKELQSQFSQSLVGRIEALDYIQQYKIPLDGSAKEFKNSIKDNMVFAYFNGSVWYDVNPVIKETISLYKRKSSDERVSNS